VTGFDAERFDRLVSQRAPAGRTPGAVAPGQPDEGGATHDADALDSLLVHSFMLFDATCADADRAAKKLYAAFIDLNELRVSRVDEIVAAIGARYPRAEDRASGLKRTLNDLFQRENAVTLAVIAEKNKRDARQFLCSLDGCPHYVASRLLLVGFGGHAIPVDDLLLARLRDARVFDDSVDLDRAASLLERHVKAADALATHLALETLRDEEPKPAPRTRGARAVGKRA